MTTPRVCVASLGGAIALFTLCYGIVRESAVAWRLLLALFPLLIVFIWWMVDRAALERRIRRLEARSEIADERRVTAQTNLTEAERRLHEIEGRVVGIENLASPTQESQGRTDSREMENGKGHIQLGYGDKTSIVRLPVNPQ